jgi:predicted transcriptional regulator
LLLTRQKYGYKANRQALQANNLQYQVQKIKVPVFILNSSVTSKKLYKLYATYLAFKALEKSSIILDYTTKAADIAALFGISKSKLDKQIKSLVNIGLVSKSLKNLIIAPYSKLYDLHPAQGKSYCYVKVKPNTPLEYALTTKKIAKNLEKQAYTVINRIKRFDDVCTDKEAILLQREYMQSIIKAFKNNTSPGNTPPGNLDISLSQAKIASLLGLKSSTGGHYWQQRLQTIGYIKVTTRQIVSNKSTREINAPKIGRWGYNNKAKVSFITLPNALTFA